MLFSLGALGGCASSPPQVTPEVSRLMTVQDIVLDAPDAGLDFSAVLAHYKGRVADAETRERLGSELQDAYDWADWRHVTVTIQPDEQNAQRWLVRVRADPPEDLPPSPTALLPTLLTPMTMPAMARRVEPGGARVEITLDARFDSWMRSADRVLIDASSHRLYFKRADGQVVSYPVALGTPRTPTPARAYRVESVSHKPTWYPPASIRREYKAKGKPLPAFVPPGPGNPLGSYFIRLQDSIGIHGTNQPRSIGRAASHGCIRMHDRDVRELAPQIKAGDGVTVVQALPSLTASKDTP